MTTDSDNIDIQDYIQTAPVPKDVMINELNYFLKEIGNDNLRTVTIELLNKYKKQFISYPAAKSMHHDFLFRFDLSYYNDVKNSESFSSYLSIIK